MSIKCDSCKQNLNQDDGSARMMISDPTPDFRGGEMPVIRRSPQLDLCATCLVKAIEILGLPADAFVPRSKPAAPAAPPESSGALTPDDLIELGLTDGNVPKERS